MHTAADAVLLLKSANHNSVADLCRHTDLRALETSKLDDHHQLQHSESTDTLSNPSTPRASRLHTNQDTVLPLRRHVRGARSLSPQRHERMHSTSALDNYRHRQTFSNSHNVFRVDAKGSSNSVQQLSRGMRDVALADRLGIPGSEHKLPPISTLGSTLDRQPGLQRTPLQNQSPDGATRSPTSPQQFAVMSEESFESMVMRGQAFAMSSKSHDIELDWARDALRLTERRQARLAYTVPDSTPTLPLRLYEMQQDAIEVVYRLSSSNVARAQFEHGAILESGKSDVQVDKRSAFKLYKEASRGGYSRADYRIGTQLEHAGEMIKACEHYEFGASRDDVACLFRLGMIILLGQCDYQVDQQKGVSCIHLSALSADVDFPQGAYVWGLMLAGETDFHISESLLQRDNAAAVMYLEKAAALGLPAAQQRLGRAHELNELDCEFSPALSIHYYTLAAQGCDAEGDMALSKWYLAGSVDGAIQQDENKAYFHASIAAERGLATAEFAMGYYHEVGVGCATDLGKAQSYYRRAVDHGSEEARSRIEGLARAGTLSRKDHEFHVSTKIQARHATIKLNQQQAGRYRSRAASNVPLGPRPVCSSPGVPDKSSTPSQETITKVESYSKPANYFASGQQYNRSKISEPMKALEASRNTSRPRTSLSPPPPTPDTPLDSNARLYSQGPPSTKSPPVPEKILQASLPNGNQEIGVSKSSSFPASDIGRDRERAAPHDTSDYTRSPVAAYGSSEPPRREQDRVQTWSQQIASISHPTSPSTAPSDIGSALENHMVPGPRPESSISNMPPCRISQLSLENSRRYSANIPSSLSSQMTAPATASSSSAVPSSVTTASVTSRKAAATFEEMGIPMVNHKKQDCVMM